MPLIRCTGIVCPINNNDNFQDEILSNDATTFMQMSLRMAKKYEGDVTNSNIPVKITHVPNSTIGKVTRLYVDQLPKDVKRGNNNRHDRALFANFVITSENFMRAMQIAVRESYRKQTLVSTDEFIPKGGEGGRGVGDCQVHEVDVYKVLAGRLPGLSLSHTVVDAFSHYPINELSMCIKGVREYSVLTGATYHKDEGGGDHTLSSGMVVTDENIHQLGNWGDENFQKMVSKVCGLHTGGNIELFMGTKKRMDCLGMDSSVMTYSLDHRHKDNDTGDCGGGIREDDDAKENTQDNKVEQENTHNHSNKNDDVDQENEDVKESMATATPATTLQPPPPLQQNVASGTPSNVVHLAAPAATHTPPPTIVMAPAASNNSGHQVYVVAEAQQQGQEQQQRYVIAQPAAAPVRQVQLQPESHYVMPHQEASVTSYAPPPRASRRPQQPYVGGSSGYRPHWHHNDEDDGYGDDYYEETRPRLVRGGVRRRQEENYHDNTDYHQPEQQRPPPQHQQQRRLQTSGGGSGGLRKVKQYGYDDDVTKRRDEGYQSTITRGVKRQHSDDYEGGGGGGGGGATENQEMLKMYRGVVQYLEQRQEQQQQPQQQVPPPQSVGEQPQQATPQQNNNEVVMEAVKHLQESMKSIQEAVSAGATSNVNKMDKGEGERKEEKMQTDVVVEEQARKPVVDEIGEPKEQPGGSVGVRTRTHQYALRRGGHDYHSPEDKNIYAIKQNAAKILDIYDKSR